MAERAKNKEDWESLPNFVRLNSRQAGMFDDRELSGLFLHQTPQKDMDGNEIKYWGHVPKENDCRRIKMALDVNNLFPCNPKGDSRLASAPIIKEDSMEALMGKNTKEIVALLPHINEIEFLTSMREVEDAKGEERRSIVIQEIALRMKSGDIQGLSTVRDEPAMIRDASGKMVQDDIILV